MKLRKQTTKHMPTLDINDYTLKVLPAKAIRTLVYSLKPDNTQSFRTQYQEAYVFKPDATYLTLYDLLTGALVNSEQTYQQYETQPASVKKLASQIFVEDLWLKRDPTVARVDGSLYLIGGRHRVLALVNTFAEIARKVTSNEDEQNEYFNELLSQEVRVEVLEVRDLNIVLSLIMSDNTSRIMRKSERSHLEAQLLGASAFSADDIAVATYYPDLSPKEVIGVAAQYFTRQADQHTKPQTRQTVGEYIAKFIIYGLLPNAKLTKNSTMKVKQGGTYLEMMAKAWDVYQDVTANKTVVAANASSIAHEIIEVLLSSPTQNEVPAGDDSLEEEAPFAEKRRRGRPKKNEGTQLF